MAVAETGAERGSPFGNETDFTGVGLFGVDEAGPDGPEALGPPLEAAREGSVLVVVVGVNGGGSVVEVGGCDGDVVVVVVVVVVTVVVVTVVVVVDDDAVDGCEAMARAGHNASSSVSQRAIFAPARHLIAAE